MLSHLTRKNGLRFGQMILCPLLRRTATFEALSDGGVAIVPEEQEDGPDDDTNDEADGDGDDDDDDDDDNGDDTTCPVRMLP